VNERYRTGGYSERLTEDVVQELDVLLVEDVDFGESADELPENGRVEGKILVNEVLDFLRKLGGVVRAQQHCLLLDLVELIELGGLGVGLATGAETVDEVSVEHVPRSDELEPDLAKVREDARAVLARVVAPGLERVVEKVVEKADLPRSIRKRLDLYPVLVLKLLHKVEIQINRFQHMRLLGRHWAVS
jgi:hypothetical protein